MTSLHTEVLDQRTRDLRPAGARVPTIDRLGGVRLIVGVLTVLVLVALGAADARRSMPDQAASDAASLAEPDPAPAFDGRGKWGGYAR